MAVYTEVSNEDLIKFITDYDIGELRSCKGIAEGIENTNYLMVTDRGSFILTLYEKRVDPDDLPFFLGFMDHLASKGIQAPVPVKGRDGLALRSLCGRPAAIVTFLDGIWHRRVKPDHCFQLGTALAKMHLVGQDFHLRRANSLTLGNWRELFNDVLERADEAKQGLTKEIENELTFLENAWPDRLPSGIIHADLFPDNVFFQGDKLSGMIDFYFACNDFLAYEIAICLDAWCFEPDGNFNITKARCFLTAYQDVRAFSPIELEYLPVLARGASMRFLLTRLYDWLNMPTNALVTRKDPLEFLEKLRFHQGIKRPGEYGINY